MLYRIAEDNSSVHYPIFTFFNPIRVRKPEQSAEVFLSLLKTDCTQATSVLPITDEERQQKCESNKEHPIVEWKLIDRIDKKDLIEVDYWVTFEGIERPGLRRITLEKNDELWKVVDYSIQY